MQVTISQHDEEEIKRGREEEEKRRRRKGSQMVKKGRLRLWGTRERERAHTNTTRAGVDGRCEEAVGGVCCLVLVKTVAINSSNKSNGDSDQ